ncbi:hypothetical protein [Microbulbifer taiwanensis]|uniref:Uncharacterized protein n=1 Tax=Microbulbifer taiwanensis TaxID=986746 RepID=A0ABW1YMN3_9GAMM
MCNFHISSSFRRRPDCVGMDAVASIRAANGPKGVAQERHLIQVPPNWIPACAGMT